MRPLPNGEPTEFAAAALYRQQAEAERRKRALRELEDHRK